MSFGSEKTLVPVLHESFLMAPRTVLPKLAELQQTLALLESVHAIWDKFSCPHIDSSFLTGGARIRGAYSPANSGTGKAKGVWSIVKTPPRRKGNVNLTDM